MSTKAIIFCRVSSKEQEETGYSLDAQHKLLTQYADKCGFEVLKTFKVSESASGKQARKLFYEMLAFVKKNDISAICVEKIDRLTRNLKDAAIVNEWVQENETRELHFVKENSIISKRTRAHENFVWDMKVAIARFYTNNLSEEVRKGQREKLAQGWLPTKPPLGYKGTGDKGYRIHVLDEERAPLVRQMFELYSTGNYSINALVEERYKAGLRNRVGKKLGRARMHALLTDPFYHGKLRWNGEVYQGRHEPLISAMLFESVEQRLKRKMGSSQQRRHTPVFKAKIRCKECGGTITWENQKTHWYGHCNHYKSCSQKRWWRQEEVEAQLFPLFKAVAPKSDRILNALEKAISELNANKRDQHATAYASLTRSCESVRRKLDALYDDKADGKITTEFYERKRQEYAREEEEALESIKSLDEDKAEYHLAGTAIHGLAAHAAEIYQSAAAGIEEKRLLLSKIFSNLSLNDEEIRPTYTAAFQFLFEWMPKLNETFEPLRNGSTKAPEVDSWASFPVVLAWREAFRMFDWQNAIDDPELTLREVKQLLSICDRVAVAVE